MNIDQITFSLLRAVARGDRSRRLLGPVLRPFNPFDPVRHSDPYALYDRTRHRGPVFHHRLLRTWIVTGYQEATELLRGPVSVDRRSLIESITPYRNMRPENADLFLSTMLMVDPPDHGRLRKLVNRAFTPRAVAELAPRITELTEELIEELPTFAATTGDPVDVQTGLADRLPIYTISEMLGVPRNRWDELKELFDVITRFVEPFTGFDPAEMDNAIDRLRALIGELADQRAADPGEDLLSALVHAEADGDRLSHSELTGMVALLLIAGHETTSGMIGNSLLALGRNPEAVGLLERRPELLDNAVEELLRYDSSIQATDRTMVADFTIGDVTIPEGAVVMILLGAANRDPRRYAEADTLKLDRHQPRPISFGHGIHHCVGAALARLELAAVLSAFVTTYPRFRLADVGPTWRRSMTLRGPETLPVILEPDHRSGLSGAPISVAAG